jgi:hypothetical protein
MANVTYQVYAGGRWLPNVTNLNDYAGIYGTPIQAVYANLSSGSIQYRTHTQNGSWLPWVSDRSDYAGIYGQNIDGLQMKITGLSGCDVRYRAYVGGRWLPWVTGASDYAGIYGQAISGIQVEIVSGNGGSGEGGGNTSSKQQAVVNSARKLIGKPYVYGGNYPPLGNSSGTDCSGLMQFSYNDIGIRISRTTFTQINEGVAVYENNLQLGDLVFPESSHVFMYSGEKDGRHMCVEAPYTGVNIRERSFTWTSGTRARRIL